MNRYGQDQEDTFRKQSQLPVDLFADELNVDDLRTNTQLPPEPQPAENSPEQNQNQFLKYQGPPTLGSYERVNHHAFEAQKTAKNDQTSSVTEKDYAQMMGLGNVISSPTDEYMGGTSSADKQGIRRDQMRALSQADLMASQISDVSSYRPGEFKKKYDKELHLMIDDLDIPNESLTLSSMSQSPWRGRSQRSYVSNLTTSQRENIDLNADQGAPISGRLVSSPSQMTGDMSQNGGGGFLALTKLEMKNFNASNDSQDEDLLQINGKGQIDHQKNPTFKSIQERGSPAFARDFDDLTLSATDDDPANKSSTRGISIHPLKAKLGLEMSASTTQPFGLKQQFLRNQNRTFADSVLDHHASSQMAGVKHEGSSQLGRTAFDGRSSLPFDREDEPERAHARLQPTGILVDDKPEQQRRISDDYSDLDYLAQTQISNNLMAGALNSQNARSKLFARVSNPSIYDQDGVEREKGPDSNEMSQFGKSNITDNGAATKRTAHGLFAQFDDAESLNQTPEKDLNSQDLAFQNKQGLDQNELDESAWMKSLLSQKDRTAESQLNQFSDRLSSQNENNPLSQLKARIREQNMKKKIPIAQQVSQNQPQSGKNGQNLSSATNFQPPQNALSVEGSQSLTRSASNLDSNNFENRLNQNQLFQMQEHLQSLESQLKMTQTSQQEAEIQNQTLKEQIAILEANLRKTKQGNNSARSGNGPLSSAVSSSQGGNELLRARALEAAREENRELRGQVDELKASNERLKEGRINIEQQHRSQIEAIEQQMSTLKLNLDKQQIIVTSHKRDRDAAIQESERLRRETQELQQETEQKIKKRVLDYESQLALLGQTVNQLEQEALDAEKRIQTSLAQLKERDEMIQTLDVACADLKNELNVQRAKSQELDNELEAIRKSNVEKHNLNAQASLQAEQTKMSNFDSELAQMKETYSKQVAQIREENLRLKQNLHDQTSRVKALEQEKADLRPQKSENCSGSEKCEVWKIVEQIAASLNLENNYQCNEPNFVVKTTELTYMKVIEIAETAKIIENELEKVQNEVSDTQNELLKKSEEILALKQELKTKQETVVPSMSNFTRNLLEKRDKEVELAKNETESIRLSLVEIQAELKKSQNECLQFSNQIDLQKQELDKFIKAKEVSESTIEELKSKLRDQQMKQNQVNSADQKNLPNQQELQILETKLENQNNQISQLKESNETLKVESLNFAEVKSSLESKVSQLSSAKDLLINYLSENRVPDFCEPLSEYAQQAQKAILSFEQLSKKMFDEKVKQLSDPAIIESFSQEYAEYMYKKQEANTPADIPFVDLVQSQDKPLSRQRSNPDCLQLQKIPSLLSQDSQKQTSTSARLSKNPENSEFKKIQETLNRVEVELEAKNQMVKARNATIGDLQAQLATLKNVQHSAQTEKVAQEIEDFKQRIMEEVNQKQAELEQEAENIEKDRVNVETSLLRKKKEHDLAVQQLKEEHQKVLSDNQNLISDLQKQLEQLNLKNEALSRSEQMPLQSNGVSPSKLTAENTRLQAQIREKDREIKRMKDDIERQRKAHQDRLKQVNDEFNETSKQIEDDMVLKQEEAILKQKKIQEKALEKVRSDLRNQIDDLKNENAKKEADWQRERKKMQQECDGAVKEALKAFEEDQESKIKEAKTQVEKIWRKKIADMQKKSEQTISQLNQNLEDLKKKNEQELESVKEMAEFETAEKIQKLITQELSDKNEHELAQIRSLHEQELLSVQKEMKLQAEKAQEEIKKLSEELSNINKKPCVEAQVQVSQNFTHYDLSRDLPLSPAANTRKNKHLQSQNEEKESEPMAVREHSPPVSSNSSRNPLSSSGTCLCGASHSDAVSQSPRDIYLESELRRQIEKEAREKYGRELDKVRVDHASILAQNTTSSTKILQELVLLECEKILEFISFKAKSEQISEEELNRRRTKINGMIKSTLESNSQLSNGKPNKQLKNSFDRCKKKISEVLAALKSQLEQRYSARLENLAQTTSDQIAAQYSQEQKTHIVNQHDQLPQPNRNQLIRVSSTSLIGHSVDMQGQYTPDKLLMPLGQTTLNGKDQQNTSNLNPIPLQSSKKPARNQNYTRNNNAGVVQESLHSEHFKMLQSREFATGYLAKNASQSLDLQNIQASSRANHPYQQANQDECDEILSDEERQETRMRQNPNDDGEVVIRGSMHTIQASEMFSAAQEEEKRGRALLNKIGPNEVNKDGAIVVEVQKVVRDLGMLHRTIKMAKFYRILLTGQPQQNANLSRTIPTASIDFDEILNQDFNSSEGQDRVVQTYRDLLNDFFKLISNLNNAIEQITQTSEVYKLRLLNVDLKTQMQDLKKETAGMVTRKRVEEILNHYQNDQRISEPTRKALDALEQSSFQISRTQFKMNQLADLFLGPKGALNLQRDQVNSKCEEFAEQGGEFFETTLNNSSDRILDGFDAETADGISTANPMTSKKMNTSFPVQAEMLSPDETVQLLANVMQKMTGLNQTQNMIEPIAHHQTNQANLSIISNEDVIKQALQICAASTQNANKSVLSHHSSNLPPQGQQRQRKVHDNNSLIMPPNHKNRTATSIEAQSLINYQRSRSAQQTQYMSAQNRTASENARMEQKLNLNLARVQDAQNMPQQQQVWSQRMHRPTPPSHQSQMRSINIGQPRTNRGNMYISSSMTTPTGGAAPIYATIDHPHRKADYPEEVAISSISKQSTLEMQQQRQTNQSKRLRMPQPRIPQSTSTTSAYRVQNDLSPQGNNFSLPEQEHFSLGIGQQHMVVSQQQNKHQTSTQRHKPHSRYQTTNTISADMSQEMHNQTNVSQNQIYYQGNRSGFVNQNHTPHSTHGVLQNNFFERQPQTPLSDLGEPKEFIHTSAIPQNQPIYQNQAYHRSPQEIPNNIGGGEYAHQDSPNFSNNDVLYDDQNPQQNQEQIQEEGGEEAWQGPSEETYQEKSTSQFNFYEGELNQQPMDGEMGSSPSAQQLNNAQHNVNHLFEQLKSKFAQDRQD